MSGDPSIAPTCLTDVRYQARLATTRPRTNHRLQAIIKALKHRDKETIAIEARLRQTMIDRIGGPQGVPADDEPATGSLTLTNDQESRPDAE